MVAHVFSRTISLILHAVSKLYIVTADCCPYMVLKTPTLPLVIPPSDRNNMACQKVVENANPRHDITRGQLAGSKTRGSGWHTGAAEAYQQNGFSAKAAGVCDSAPSHGG